MKREIEGVNGQKVSPGAPDVSHLENLMSITHLNRIDLECTYWELDFTKSSRTISESVIGVKEENGASGLNLIETFQALENFDGSKAS